MPIGDSGTCENPVPDGNVNGKNERVTYSYDAGSRVLRRYLYEGTASQTWTPLLEQVEPNPGNVPLFTFLDGNGIQITDNDKRGDIRTVSSR